MGLLKPFLSSTVVADNGFRVLIETALNRYEKFRVKVDQKEVGSYGRIIICYCGECGLRLISNESRGLSDKWRESEHG